MSRPNRSIMSFPITGKKFISCSPFCSHLNLVALEKILTQRHRIITHGHAAAITFLLFLLIFALLALFLCLTKFFLYRLTPPPHLSHSPVLYPTAWAPQLSTVTYGVSRKQHGTTKIDRESIRDNQPESRTSL
jgi:hypothetical protein